MDDWVGVREIGSPEARGDDLTSGLKRNFELKKFAGPSKDQDA
jgi:hypothetical protein